MQIQMFGFTKANRIKRYEFDTGMPHLKTSDGSWCHRRNPDRCFHSLEHSVNNSADERWQCQIYGGRPSLRSSTHHDTRFSSFGEIDTGWIYGAPLTPTILPMVYLRSFIQFPPPCRKGLASTELLMTSSQQSHGAAKVAFKSGRPTIIAFQQQTFLQIQEMIQHS